ncbi:3-hydroxyisobutyrate dehydrogenase [Rhinocladiella mackenziei CBS 650.93]|uniref:3-hydroxyisobutyrate dehydrogenase n=1 Tax=Rhinocladiella mackenziei CBS 650.93 TaxID=1442369 RepID=A0A0D2FXU4_9EURO|nr:3-hydroxyisobutyrate dehydrogenase [Rhinocladiella mackenziei CBS 650.93]KIX07112.1 3-hydroxyisobutyrate dehydrogenase [Rhinocladiella mackenziei CBS 650.93]
MDLSKISGLGFVGLGAMGLPMAGHLAAKLPENITVYVFDINPSSVERLRSEYPNRVVRCSSAKDVADQSEIVLTMLPEGKHVRSVYMEGGSDALCSSDVSGKLLIDCSTIDTASSLTVKDYIHQKFPTASFYDAPVSGGVVGAQKGTIAFFLGCDGSDANLPHVTQLLGLMGKDVIPCGGPSKGLAAKLSNNYLSGIITIAVAEAMDMGMRSGLDPRVLAKVYAAGTAQNAICDRFCPVPGVYPEAPSSKGYTNGFKVQLMRKDFSLALEMAKRVGANNVMGEVGLQTYDGASKDPRCRDLDSRVVYRYLGGNEDWQKDVDEANGQ